MYQVKIEPFEGPLDLLLELIEAEKLEITQISLARVADQFVDYLKQNKDIPPAEMADFLVIASKLILIKSKTLLPYLHFEAEEEALKLEDQLKIYKEYYDASKVLQKIISKKNFFYNREKPMIVAAFRPPDKFDISKLTQIFEEVARRIEPILRLPKQIIKNAISIKEKIESIFNLISREIQTSWKTIVKNSKDKTEIIVSFLALLELIKQKMVVIEQADLFEDITISKNNSS